MILLLDIGISRLKWATARGSKPSAGTAIEHDGKPAQTIARIPKGRIESVWIAQVLGREAERPLVKAVHARFGLRPQFARTAATCAGLRVAYAEPALLGVDRWLAMLALWTETRRAFCVVNAGTALTFDAVDGQGRHRGGLIAPGLTTAEKAVLGATRFPVCSKKPAYEKGLGRDTESCVRQGALHACAGLIERAASLQRGARIISGGDAGTLHPHLDSGWALRPNLVLEGLLSLARSQ